MTLDSRSWPESRVAKPEPPSPGLESPASILSHIVGLRRNWPQPGEKDLYDPAETIEQLWGAMNRLGWSVQPAPEMDFVPQLDPQWLSDSLESKAFRFKQWQRFHDALCIAEFAAKEHQASAAIPSSANGSAAKATEDASNAATTQPKLKPSQEKAYRQYKHAVEKMLNWMERRTATFTIG